MGLALTLVLGLVLAAGSAQAGERTVGNGGGLAEMKAARVLRQLPLFTEFCLVASNPCGLTAEEASTLEAESERLLSESKLTVVDFKHDIKTRYVTGANVGSKLWVLSRDLYRTDGISKTFGEIGALVLEGLLSRPSIEHTAGAPEVGVNGSPAMRVLSEKVFSDLHEQTQSLRVGVDWVHLISLERAGRTRSDLLVVEYEKESLDLTAELSKRLGCESAQSFSGQFSSFGATGSTVAPKATVSLKWRCDQTSGAGTITVAPTPLNVVLSELELN